MHVNGVLRLLVARALASVFHHVLVRSLNPLKAGAGDISEKGKDGALELDFESEGTVVRSFLHYELAIGYAPFCLQWYRDSRSVAALSQALTLLTVLAAPERGFPTSKMFLDTLMSELGYRKRRVSMTKEPTPSIDEARAGSEGDSTPTTEEKETEASSSDSRRAKKAPFDVPMQMLPKWLSHEMAWREARRLALNQIATLARSLEVQ